MGQASTSSTDNGLIISPILGTSGMAESSATTRVNFKKAPAPKLGEAFGVGWGQNSADDWRVLPGGGVLQFNLSRLTLSDFRMMRDHYQIKASLSVLTFMMHQLDWTIECDNAKIRNFCQENLSVIWTRLVRAMSQSFWAGYSPNVLQWENVDTNVRLTKIKDLMPEECSVHWKTVEGWAPPGRIPPKIKVFDGIDQVGAQYAVPTENSFWYPLLMENGNYYGTKLLRSAFTSWYFSILMHLFSNRYFERFGEPLPIGRAPFDDTLTVDGETMTGREAMLAILMQLRSRSAVVLPESRTQVGTAGEAKYDYEIEYLESQMRGADFERYLMRLDEEISLSLFTPLLMLRTADVGSYNLGTQQNQVYQQMLNALSGDWAQYINDYILERMVDFNFGVNAKRAKIRFRRLGDDKMEMVKLIMQQLLAGGKVMPDLNELGEIAGLTLKEVEVVTEPPAEPRQDPGNEPAEGGNQNPVNSSRLIEAMYERIAGQYRKSGKMDLGYKRQYIEAAGMHGVAVADAERTYSATVGWLNDLSAMEFDSSTDVLALIRKGLESGVGEHLNGKAS